MNQFSHNSQEDFEEDDYDNFFDYDNETAFKNFDEGGDGLELVIGEEIGARDGRGSRNCGNYVKPHFSFVIRTLN